MPVTVTRLSLTPVKGTRVREVESIRLELGGVPDNRRFYVIDPEGQMVNSLRLGELQTVVSVYDESERRLRLEFPDGQVLEEEVRLGPVVETQFYSERVPARLLEGRWSEAMSEIAGRPLRLVEASNGGAVDRGPRGGVSLISRASLDRLASVGGLEEIDPRRFRMLVEVDGIDAHAEDSWVGQAARIGEARVEFGGHVGRCAITTRHPETGKVDVPTLKLLGRYRRDEETTEPVAFGIYGRVAEPGSIRLGDELVLDG